MQFRGNQPKHKPCGRTILYGTKGLWTPIQPHPEFFFLEFGRKCSVAQSWYIQTTPWSNYGMPLHLPKGVQVQRGPWRSNTPNGQRTAAPLTSQPTQQPLCTVSGQTTTRTSPAQNAALTRRALEEWERTICENKAVAILEKLQEGRPALFQNDGRAMLVVHCY